MNKRNKRSHSKNAEKQQKKKLFEFSKIVVVFVLAFTVLCTIASYELSMQGAEACTEIPTALITTTFGVIVGYFIKSFGEKNSRNKYGIDVDGTRIVSPEPEEEIEFEPETNGGQNV